MRFFKIFALAEILMLCLTIYLNAIAQNIGSDHFSLASGVALNGNTFKTITINLSYFIQTKGPYKSGLATNSQWPYWYHDGDRLKKIHDLVRNIWAKAGINIISSFAHDSDDILAVPNKYDIDYWMYHRSPLISGSDPREYRSSLNGTNRIIQGLFLWRAYQSALDHNDVDGQWKGFNPELAIHLIGSLQNDSKYRNTLGLYVPEGWRKTNITSQEVKFKLGPYVPPNTTTYIIIVGDINEVFKTDYDLASVIAHEIGHAFGLEDIENEGNLMNKYLVNGSPNRLTNSQIDRALRGARDFVKYGPLSTYKRLCCFQDGVLERARKSTKKAELQLIKKQNDLELLYERLKNKEILMERVLKEKAIIEERLKHP